MDLVGCGCMGFSFTTKYKTAIISLYDMVNELGDIGIVSYQDLQERIANKGVSDESEIRMIIPFLIKSNVINEANCIKTTTGTRLRKLIINKDFFTESGVEFIKVLALEINKENSEDNEVREKIEALYHKAGLFLYLNLCKSVDYIYKELFFFLKKYTSIDKNEFYLLTDCIENCRKDQLDELITNYRQNKIGEIRIVKNVNDWQYLMGTLQQFGVVLEEDKKFYLTKDASTLEVK